MSDTPALPELPHPPIEALNPSGTWTESQVLLIQDYARAAFAAQAEAHAAEVERWKELMHDEITENLRLRELGGAGPDENITAMTERLIAERASLTAERDAAQEDLRRTHQDALAERDALRADAERLRIRGEAYESAYGIAYQATYQSHNGHWDHTMRGGLGCRECIRAREARENCDARLREGLEALAARAQGGTE